MLVVELYVLRVGKSERPKSSMLTIVRCGDVRE